MQIEKKCIICGKQDWQDIDYLRRQPQSMIVCRECGFITFNRFNDKNEYENYYENDYRKGTVNTSNLITTNRKLGYHQVFIGDYLKEHKNLGICDIGAGIGYFLRWARDAYGHKNVTGVELDLHMRRYAYNAFDIRLTKHFDTAKKYDLICMYHSFEHIPDPIGMLEKIEKCLNPDGKLYIAVPVWMEELYNFGGMPYKDLDEYFHPNHLNAWSKEQFKFFMASHGWKIVKEHHKIYGYTVLFEKDKLQNSILEIPKKDIKDIEYQLSTMQKASVAYQKGDFKEAIRLYPKFVDAYLAEIGTQTKDFNRQILLCDAGIQACPNIMIFYAQKGMLFYQHDMLEKSQELLLEVLKTRPFDENIILHLALISLRIGEKQLKENKEKGKEILKNACQLFDQILKINPGNYNQAYNYIAYILSKIPLDNEQQEIKFNQPGIENSPKVTFDGKMASI